jgi:CRP/FNR family transcriptional regulator, cyclic AMP receptor protein
MLTAQDIKGYTLFTGLTEPQLSQIAAICTRRRYQADDVIFDPDTPSGDLFLLERGNDAIQIEIPIGSHEDKIVIHTLSKGEVFGWAALGPPHARTAIARCLEQVDVIAMNGQELRQLLDADSRIGYVVMKNLSGFISSRLAYTTVAFRHEIRMLRKKLNVPVN